MAAKKVLRDLVRKITGVEIFKYNYPDYFSEESMKICDIVRPYTLTNSLRVNALIDAVRYIVSNAICGSFVECGVWKGGSVIAMALTLNALGVKDRDLFLYDTFSGMPRPDDIDSAIDGTHSVKKFNRLRTSEDSSNWCLAALEEVKENVFSTGYPKERFHFIKGKVEDTVPANVPEKIALLRLDTDFYSSTKHEMTHLFPILEKNGVLIVDDYGFFEGSKKAVDEYIKEKNVCILLNATDNLGGRIAVKT